MMRFALRSVSVLAGVALAIGFGVGVALLSPLILAVAVHEWLADPRGRMR